jgi:hypothetical protein
MGEQANWRSPQKCHAMFFAKLNLVTLAKRP